MSKEAIEHYEAALKEAFPSGATGDVFHHWNEARKALAEQPAQDNTYGYAKYLAEAMFKRHFASDEHYASGRVVWGVNDTVIGILTQIDNMVADMVRRPAQQEPVAWLKVIETPGGWGKFVEAKPHEKGANPVYTSPPASKPLTDEQILAANYPDGEENGPTIAAPDFELICFARQIEAKLREKNNG